MPRCAFKEGCYINLNPNLDLNSIKMMTELLGKGPYLVKKAEIYDNRWLLTIETVYDVRKVWANLCVVVEPQKE